MHLVNARYERLGDLKCYPSLAALPEPPDCVAVAVPREAAESVIREAGEAGAGGVILYASGYAETRKPERMAEHGAKVVISSRKAGIPAADPGSELSRDC